MFAVAVCLVFCVGTLSSVWGELQQNASDSNSERVSGLAVITAKPERVTFGEGSGSTEIEWDTGDGSMGFVFVTEDVGKPALFANSSRGKEVAPWIGKHTYVFELYGDDQRQTLLAKVTVFGSAESTSSQQTVSWQVVARWALIIGLAAVLYFAVYLSSIGPVRTTFPTEPTTSPRQLHVARNLLLGIVAFICVDGAIFHSGLYVSILAPSSYAGRVSRITRAEKERAPSGLKEVLVLGDSRIAEGFSATLANELGSPSGLKFVSLAEPAASANTWYYMVREVDPTARRYAAIVIPYGIGYEPNKRRCPPDFYDSSATAIWRLLPFCLWFSTMVWPVQGIYRVHTTRLSVPGRRCRSSCASRGANDKHSTGRRSALRTRSTKDGITILWGHPTMQRQDR